MPNTKPLVSQTAQLRAYASPTLVLLAFDWAEGAAHPDFLGFALRRSPGFSPGHATDYFFNKISFEPPEKDALPITSDRAPIQKFMWWDPVITPEDAGKVMTYTVVPVLGTGKDDLHLQEQARCTLQVTIPPIVRDGIGTWFNRAVVSSQAFSREFPKGHFDLDKAMAWLANGMQNAIPDFIHASEELDGAIYHLTDNEWVIPALRQFSGDASLVYFLKDKPKNGDTTNVKTIEALQPQQNIHFAPRTKTAIMHNKFLVRVSNGKPEAVLMGSANFTPEGLTTQANLLHTFDSPELAALYAARQVELAQDPTVAQTAKGAAWSNPVTVGKAQIRVFFSPEATKQRVSIDTVVKAVQAAKHSVVFAMFDPTDPALLNALLAVSDKKKLLYGLLNSIKDPSTASQSQSSSGEPPTAPSPAAQVQVTLFNRSRQDKLVLPYSYFSPQNTPADFLPEFSTIDVSSKSIGGAAPGGADSKIPAVHIHHKFIVIDAETAQPTIYTGSANMSNNSTHNNDENLLEIKNTPELAQTYLAEFMRLYEHYRARAIYNAAEQAAHSKTQAIKVAAASAHDRFILKTTRDGWVKGAYKKNTPEYIARVELAAPVS